SDILSEELARMTRERVTDRELSLAKAYLIGSFPLRLDTSAKVADFLIAVEELGLGLDYADRYRELIARVTADDGLRVAGQYFPPQTLNRVVVGPAPSGPPAAPPPSPSRWPSPTFRPRARRSR